jgi:hypothetical protein
LTSTHSYGPFSTLVSQEKVILPLRLGLSGFRLAGKLILVASKKAFPSVWNGAHGRRDLARSSRRHPGMTMRETRIDMPSLIRSVSHGLDGVGTGDKIPLRTLRTPLRSEGDTSKSRRRRSKSMSERVALQVTLLCSPFHGVIISTNYEKHMAQAHKILESRVLSFARKKCDSLVGTPIDFVV